MSDKKRIKRPRFSASSDVHHEVVVSESLQHSPLMQSFCESTTSPSKFVANSMATPSSCSSSMTLSSQALPSGMNSCSEISYSVDVGENKKSPLTDIIHDKSSDEIVKCSAINDKHLLSTINSESLCEAVALLHAKDNSFTQDGLNQAPIYACRRGYKLLVQTLVGMGANIEHRDENGNTPLLICSEQGFTDIVWFLVFNNANVNARNSTGNTALILSVRPAGSTDLTRFLLEQKDIDIHHENQDGHTALNRATHFMDVNTMRLLLEKSLGRKKDRLLGEKLLITKSCIGYIKYYLDKEYGHFFNNKAQSIKQEAISAKAGLKNVYTILKEHVISRKSPLQLAIKAGDAKSLDIFLHCQFSWSSDKHRDIDSASSDKQMDINRALMSIFINDHTECAKLLIQHGAKMDVTSALRSAVEYQRPLCMRFLFENYKHEIMDYFSKKPLNARELLILAVEKENSEIIGHILDAGVDVNGTDSYGQTPLMASENRTVVEFLFQRGADVNHVIEGRNGSETLLSRTISKNYISASTVEVCKVLIDNGASVNSRSGEGKTPLMMAASRDDCVSLLQMLLDNGADVNDKDNKGNNALLHAITEKCFKNVSCLIDFIRDNKNVINIQNNEGVTPLIASVMDSFYHKNVAIVKKLIEDGADVNIKDNNENTALHHLIIHSECTQSPWDSEEMLTILLKDGSHVNCQNRDGLSPLMLAAQMAMAPFVSKLLDAGADVNAVSKKNNSQTAMSLLPYSSFQNQHILCIELLLHKDASSSYLNHEYLSRLIIWDQIDVISKRIQHGVGPADIKANRIPWRVIRHGLPTTLSPLSVALLHGKIPLARYFVDILFLTGSDLLMFASNKAMEHLLKEEDQRESLSYLQELSSQPWSLVKLSLVTVSAAVGSSPGRESRVDSLPLPLMMKDRLRFKSMNDEDLALLKLHPEPNTVLRYDDSDFENDSDFDDEYFVHALTTQIPMTVGTI